MLNYSFSVHSGTKNERRFLTIFHQQLIKLFDDSKQAAKLKRVQEQQKCFKILEFINGTFNRSLRRQNESFYKEQILLQFLKTLKIWTFGEKHRANCEHPYYFHTLFITLKKLKSFNQSYEWVCSLQAIFGEIVDSLNFTLLNNFKAGIHLQEINAALSLIKLEQMFGKVPRLFDSVRRLLARQTSTTNFKKTLKFILNSKDQEWLQKIQDWTVGEPESIYKEYLQFSSSKARIQLSNLPPFHSNCNSFTVSYLQCLTHSIHNAQKKNQNISLVFIEGMEIGKDDVVAELKAEPDLDVQQNEAPRYKLSISTLISTESITLTGNWCVFSLNFKVKSGQRISRVRLMIENQDNEFTQISFTPVSQNFWLKRVSIEATNSLLGPIIIGKQPGSPDEASFQNMNSIYKSEAVQLQKSRVILTPRMLQSCFNQSNLLSSAYYPHIRYSNFSTSLKKFQAMGESNYFVECRVQSDTSPTFKVVEQLRESFAKFDGYLYLIPYLNQAVIDRYNRPLLINQIRFFIQFLEVSIKENKNLVNYEQSFQFLELSLHEYVGDLSALSKEIFTVYQAFELEQRQYYAEFFIRLVLHPKIAPYAINNDTMIREISTLYKKSLHDSSSTGKHEHHFNILARLVDFLSYNLIGSSKFLLSGNQMIQTDLFELIFNLNKTAFVEVVHEKILRERSGKILILLLWILAKISTLVLQKKLNTSVDKQLLKSIKSSQIFNTLLLSEVHTIFQEDQGLESSVIFRAEQESKEASNLVSSRNSNRSNISIRSFLTEEIKVQLNRVEDDSINEIRKTNSNRRNIMVYSFKDSTEYAQALNLAMRLHFNLKVAEIQRGSNSISLLFFGKQGIVKQIEQQIQELLERFDRYKPPLHEQTLKNLKKLCLEVVQLFEENGVAEVFTKKFMQQQFYYRVARLVPSIDLKAISAFLTIYQHQPSISYYLQICIYRLLQQQNYGLLKILLKHLSSYSEGRHFHHLIHWGILLRVLKAQSYLKPQNLKLLAQSLIQDCLYETDPKNQNSTVIFGVIQILQALTQISQLQNFIKQSLKTISKLMNYELLLVKDNYHCSSKILGICFYFLHQDLIRNNLDEESVELLSSFLFSNKNDNGQQSLNKEFQTALDLLAIDEFSSNLNFTNSGAIFILSEILALIHSTTKRNTSVNVSILYRFLAKFCVLFFQSSDAVLLPQQFHIKIKYALILEKQPISVITSKVQAMKTINNQILSADQINSFFQSLRSLADKPEIVTQFLNQSKGYIVGKLMPSLFHLSSRKIINQIKWPLSENQASIKDLQNEVYLVLAQRQARKSSSTGNQKSTQFLSISQTKKRTYRRTHLENIEQQQFKIKILQKSIRSYIKELTKVNGSIWNLSLKSDFNLCRVAFRRMNQIIRKQHNGPNNPEAREKYSFDHFTKLESVSDALGRRFFLKERRELKETQNLDIAYPNIKKYIFRKVLSLCLVNSEKAVLKRKIKRLRSLLSKNIVKIVFQNSMKTKIKAMDSVVGFVNPERPSLGRDLKNNLQWRVIQKKAKGKYDGVISLHDRYLQFQWGKNEYSLLLIEDIDYAIIRRHQMQRKAIQLFSLDGKSYKYCFNSDYELSKFCRRLQHIDYENKIKNQSKGIVFFRKPEKDFESAGISQKWLKGQISNFQYLWLLNFFADRSLNDFSSYPVYPWICNFQSPMTIRNIPKDLDQEFEQTYLRNLGKPTAVISDLKRKRLETQIETNKEFGIEGAFGDNNEKIHFIREPYSCRMIILQHLVRLEPITSRAISFDNSLDVPDRLFISMQRHYKGVLVNFQDNKELTPQFFFNPQILRNHNFLDFGVTQWGQIVHDVELPAPFYSKNHHFLQLHRILLESKLVTSNLSAWIDLIFGYYQQHQHEYNIYPWYGSEEYIAKQPEPLDPYLVHSIDLFQQLPIKLFKQKHPQFKREMIKTPKMSIVSGSEQSPSSPQKEPKVDTIMSVKSLLVRGYRELWSCREQSMEIVSSFVYVPNNTKSLLNLVNSNKQVSDKYLFILVRSKVFNFSNLYNDNVTHDLKALCNQNLSVVRIKLGSSQFSRDEVVMQLQDHPATLRDAQSYIPVSQKAMISVAHFNNSLCYIALTHPLESSSKTKGKIIVRQKFYSHDSFVSCCASDSKWAVTGSQNGVVILWRSIGAEFKMQKFFCDHDEPVVAVAINAALSVFLSIDESGSCYVRHLPSKRYLRHFNLLSSINQNHVQKYSSFALKRILISRHGYFSFCIRLEKSYLFKTFSCNGEPVSEIASRAPIKFISIDPSHDFFFVLIQVECWKIHVFNLITLEELNENHPYYPPGIKHSNSILTREEAKTWTIRSMHALEDILLLSLGDRIIQFPKSEKKMAESQWGRRINLGGYT